MRYSLLLAAACAAWGQAVPPLSFEVASIKPAAPCCAPGQWRGNRPAADRVDFQYGTLLYYVTYAYGVKSYQVAGPDWLREVRFDIAAKGSEGTRRDQLPQMMQALLAERFQLKVHRETRELPGLALIVGKNGPKLKPAGPESGDGHGGASVGMSATPEGVERMDVKGGSMTTLVNTLTALLGQPVVDRTGLAERYDFVLEYSRDRVPGPRATGGFNEPPPLPAPAVSAEPGISIYTSIQQLGLKLEAQKFPLEVIVIDHAEKAPTGN